MRVAVSGHRPNKLNNEYDGIGLVSDHLRAQLTTVIQELNPSVMITGMALGVDMIWAELAIAMDINFIAAIPCAGQSSMWPFKSKQRYHDILSSPLCTRIFVSTDPYRPDLMQKRNQWMVDNCDILVAVWDGTAGGTANCIAYAKSVKRRIIHIKPLSLTIT